MSTVSLTWKAAGISRILAILLATLHFSITATGTIRYVKNGGTGNGNSWINASGDLQAMINNNISFPGDTIYIAGGTYYPIRPRRILLHRLSTSNVQPHNQFQLR